MNQFMIAVGNFFFRWRDTAFSLIFLAAFAIIIFVPSSGIGDMRYDLAASFIGFLFALSGQIVRAVTIGLAYIKRGGLNKKIYAETLVRRGMFAHCRNPLYLGNILIVTGAIFAVHITWYYAIVLPLFYFIYICITLAEENFLRGKFGPEYDEYIKGVNRFIPGNLKDWNKSTEGMSFTWKRLINKEHSSTFVIFTSIALVTVLKLHYRHGVEFSSSYFYGFWAVMGTLAVFQIVSEILKRTGRLRWETDRP